MNTVSVTPSLSTMCMNTLATIADNPIQSLHADLKQTVENLNKWDAYSSVWSNTTQTPNSTGEKKWIYYNKIHHNFTKKDKENNPDEIYFITIGYSDLYKLIPDEDILSVSGSTSSEDTYLKMKTLAHGHFLPEDGHPQVQLNDEKKQFTYYAGYKTSKDLADRLNKALNFLKSVDPTVEGVSQNVDHLLRA